MPRGRDLVEQALVLLDKVLPAELAARGVDSASLGRVRDRIAAMTDEGAPSADSPETIFSRLGG